MSTSITNATHVATKREITPLTSIRLWYEVAESVFDRISKVKLVSRAKRSNPGVIDDARHEAYGLLLAVNHWATYRRLRDLDPERSDFRRLLSAAIGIHDYRVLCAFNSLEVLLLINSDVYERRNNIAMAHRLNALYTIVSNAQGEARRICRDIAESSRPSEPPGSAHNLKVVGGSS